MTDETQPDTFSWGDLGERFWRDAASLIRASEEQIRFAVCVHRGMKNAPAARAAGYTSDKVASREAGYKAARTTAVRNLLALAASEVDGRPNGGPMTDAEVEDVLTALIRGPDQVLKLRAIESREKLSDKKDRDRSAEFGAVADHDGLAVWRHTRAFLQAGGHGGGFSVLCWLGGGRKFIDVPLLHDVVAALLTEFPSFYALVRSELSVVDRAVLDRRLADPEWQLAERAKIWHEVGVDIAKRDEEVDSILRKANATAAPVAEVTTAQTPVTGTNGQARPGAEVANARG
jgi:hypothetical protein